MKNIIILIISTISLASCGKVDKSESKGFRKKVAEAHVRNCKSHSHETCVIFHTSNKVSGDILYLDLTK